MKKEQKPSKTQLSWQKRKKKDALHRWVLEILWDFMKEDFNDIWKLLIKSNRLKKFINGILDIVYPD